MGSINVTIPSYNDPDVNYLGYNCAITYPDTIQLSTTPLKVYDFFRNFNSRVTVKAPGFNPTLTDTISITSTGILVHISNSSKGFDNYYLLRVIPGYIYDVGFSDNYEILGLSNIHLSNSDGDIVGEMPSNYSNTFQQILSTNIETLSVSFAVGYWNNKGWYFQSLNKSFTIKFKAPTSWVPGFNFAISGNTNTVDGKYYKGYSGVSLKVSSLSFPGGATKNNASSTISFNGKSGSVDNVLTVNPITSSGNLTATAKVVDSRGRSTTKTLTIPVDEHKAPSIDPFTVNRCNDAGEIYTYGEKVKVNFIITSYNDIPGTVLSTMNFYYKESTASEWTLFYDDRFDGADASSVEYSWVLDVIKFSAIKSYNFKTEVTDTMGFSTTKTLTIPKFDHGNPVIHSFNTERCAADGTLNEDGTSVKITALLSIAKDIPQTILTTIRYFVREYGATEWTTLEDSSVDVSSENVSEYTFSQVITGYEFDTLKQYEVKLEIVDSYGAISNRVNIITKSYLTMDFLAGGKGIAFGKSSEKEGFECNMKSDFIDEAIFRSWANIASGNLNIPNSKRFYIDKKPTLLRINIGNDNTRPYYHIATTGVISNSWYDNVSIYLISQNYNGGRWGILRVSIRCNDQTSTASGYNYADGECVWLANHGFGLDQFVVKTRSAKGNCISDLYYKSQGTYNSLTVVTLLGGGRSAYNAGWTLTKEYMTYSDSRSAMDVTSYNESVNSSYTIIPVGGGGTGATSAAGARGNLGAMGAVNANGYQGLARPDGNASDWIRTTSSGIIPYSAGTPGSGSLGTSSWRFNQAHIHSIYKHGVLIGQVQKLWEGNVYKGGTITVNNSTNYELFACTYATSSWGDPLGMLLIGATTSFGGNRQCHFIGSADSGSTSWTARASFDLCNGNTWKLGAASAHNVDGSNAKSAWVRQIYGIL